MSNIEENNNISGILKTFLSPILKILIVVAIIIVIIAGAVEIIKIRDGSYSEGKDNNTGYVVQQKALSNTNIENMASTPDGWSINVDLDKKVDEIIVELEENNGCIDNYIKEENAKKYITAFINAELVTQYPDLRSDPNKIGTPTEEGEFQGCIQIHRAASDAKNGETKKLTYIDPTTFQNYKTNKDLEILNHFTLGDDGSLIYAGWTRTTTNITSNVPGVENVKDKVEFEVTQNSIPYKTVVDSYVLPFDLLWALTVSGEDEEYAYNLAQLALDSKIIFTVQDNFTTSTTTSIEEYKEQEKIEKQATLKVLYNDEVHTKVVNKPNEEEPVPYKTQTTTKMETCCVSADITYADTWIVEYINPYSNTIPNGQPNFDGEPIKLDDTESIEIESIESDEEIDGELLKFQKELCGSEEKYLLEETAGNIEGSVIGLFSKKYKRKIEHTITNSTQISYNSYVQGTPSITEKTEEFANLFNNSQSARSNILSAPSWLFKMLENGPKTADMLDLVKYLLYKSTDDDFGITSFGLNIMNLKDRKTVKGSSTENFIKAWENSLLWKYETQDNAPFPTGYLTVDGMNYLVYEDGSAGHNNIAYGWATFITDSGHVKANHPQYGGGYYNHVKAFKDVGIDVTTLYEGAPVNKEAANSAFLNVILDECIKYVDNYLKDNLPEYTFSQEQKDALISMRYQYGNLSNGSFDFARSYRNSLNEDGTLNADKIKENCSRFNYESTQNNRKYANWLLFTQEKYIDREGNEIEFGILPSAKKVHDYMSDPTHLYYYCLADGSEKEVAKHRAAGLDCGLCHSFEKSQLPETWGYRLTCCATYVSWVLVDCGYIQPEEHKHGCSSLVGVLEVERAKGNWTKITNYDDLEAGDVVFMDTSGVNNGELAHVQIYVGDGCWYNAGGNSSIHKIEPYRSDVRSEFVYAYRKN